MGLEYLPDAVRFQISPMSHDLYDGCSGVAVFLAALETVSPGEGFGDLASRALRGVRTLVADLDPVSERALVRQVGLGGGKGLGSMIYALVRVGRFLGDASFLDDARALATLVTRERVAADTKLDLMSGTAGTALGLLALHRETGDGSALERAVWCGEHLRDKRTAGACGHRAWETLPGKLLTGFSHGAAGIAYALLRLAEAADAPAYREAAYEAVAYERSVFSPEARNWPDYRGDAPAFQASWCHGAPGIGLGRLGGLDARCGGTTFDDIDAAIATTAGNGLTEIDDLCCGNFGRLETLVEAARRLSRNDLDTLARRQAAWLVRKAGRDGSYQIPPRLPRGVQPRPVQGNRRGRLLAAASGVRVAALRVALGVRLGGAARFQGDHSMNHPLITNPHGSGGVADVPDHRDRQCPVRHHHDHPLPAAVDLRPWCPPVKKQGRTNSCTAHAGTTLVEYYQRRAFPDQPPVMLSRMFLYKVTRNLLQVKDVTYRGDRVRTPERP